MHIARHPRRICFTCFGLQAHFEHKPHRIPKQTELRLVVKVPPAVYLLSTSVKEVAAAAVATSTTTTTTTTIYMQKKQHHTAATAHSRCICCTMTHPFDGLCRPITEQRS